MMRIGAKAILLAAVIAAVPGCADSYSTDPQTRFNQLREDWSRGFAELRAHLAAVHDEQSLETALPKVRATLDRMNKAWTDQQKIGFGDFEPDDDQKREFLHMMTDAIVDLKIELARIRPIPGSDEIWLELDGFFKGLKAATGPAKPALGDQTEPPKNGQPAPQESAGQDEDDLSRAAHMAGEISRAAGGNGPSGSPSPTTPPAPAAGGQGAAGTWTW